MSAFGRSRRQVWLDAQLWDLLKVAAPHEMEESETTQSEYSSVPVQRVWIQHTAETLHDAIIREWFQREDKLRYAELLKMRNAAREAADKEWVSSLPPSNTTG